MVVHFGLSMDVCSRDEGFTQHRQKQEGVCPERSAALLTYQESVRQCFANAFHPSVPSRQHQLCNLATVRIVTSINFFTCAPRHPSRPQR